MQLFSRKKAILALSIGALSALGACGDDVTVASPPDAPVVVSITPPSATMNIGESLNFAVQITGGSATTPPTLTGCASSNALVATAAISAGACRVTAVTTGNITVTATASTGGTAAASVSVNPQAASISNLTVSPTTANATVGGKVQITTNYTRAAGFTATPVTTYTPSAAAIATVSTTGEITAVAPGTATITTTVVGTQAGFTTTTLTAVTTITVTTAPNPVTGLTVQPSSLSMSVGSTSPIVASVVQVSGSAPAVITFGSTNPSVVNVIGTNPNTSGLGTVTAVGPGTAVITVTATIAAVGTTPGGTLTQLVQVTVAPSANVTINSINQGPIVTSYYETFLSSVASNADWSDGTYAGEAGIYEQNNSAVNGPVDINSVRDQIQMVVNLQPNGQRVDSVVAFIANADGSNRRAAARQIYSNGVANAEQITLYINTADFTANFAAGTADVLYPNGQKILSVSVFTTDALGAKELGNASNNRQTVNFNNLDGYAASYVNPTRVMQGDPSIPVKANLNWWGGPGTTGEGRATIIPVFYTPGRTIRVLTVGMVEESNSFHPWSGSYAGFCSSYEFAGVANPTPSPLPHTVVYGSAPTVTAAIACDGYEHGETVTSNVVGVLGGVDNSNNPLPRTTVAAGYRRSASVARPVRNRLDYEGPNTQMPEIWRERPAVSGWVNAAFNFNTNTGASHDRNGVGVKNNSRSWMYAGCGSMTPVPMPNMTGADIPECSTDFLGGWTGINPTYTRGPYWASYTELDRLDNGTTSSDSYRFGVDKTAPFIRFGTAAGTVLDTARTVNAASLLIAHQAEFLDERSGFVDASDNGAPVKNPAPWTCAVWGCSAGYGNVNVAIPGASGINPATLAVYPTDRAQWHFLSHGAGYLPAANYPTRSQCLVASNVNTDVWRLTNPFLTGLGNFVNPAATFLSNPGCTLAPALLLQYGNVGDGYKFGSPVSEPREGIYRYETKVWDRAGNVSQTISRRNGIDLNPANFASISASLGIPLGGAASFQTIFEDNTEVRAASLKLQYNSLTGSTLAAQALLGANVSMASNDTLMYSQQLLDARFNDNINGPMLANLSLPMAAPTVTSIEFTDVNGAVIPNNLGTKLSLVGGTIWDWANRQDANGATALPRQAAILGTGIADPVGFSALHAQVPVLAFQTFTMLPSLAAAYNAGTGLKAQVKAGTNSINAPFARVDFYRRGTGNCLANPGVVASAAIFNCAQGLYYIGSSSSAVSADEGGFRYWTYLAPSTLAPTYWSAETAATAIAPFDAVFAVGVRALTGEALSTPALQLTGAAINITTVTQPGTGALPWSMSFAGPGGPYVRSATGMFAVTGGNYVPTGVTVPVTTGPAAAGTCPTGLATSVASPAVSTPVPASGVAPVVFTITVSCVP